MFSQKFFSKHQLISIALAVFASVAAVAGFVYAATTIGTNVSVDGNLTVSGSAATSTFSTGGLAVGTSQFVIQQTSGRVGIGTDLTTGPAWATVEVATSGKGIDVLDTTDSNNFRVRLGSSTNNGGFIQINDASESAQLLFRSYGVSYISGGNVGIATTSPWGLLSVNPNALSAGTPQFVVGSSTQTSFIVANNGNVGIGTMSPNILGFSSNAKVLSIVSSASAQRAALELANQTNGITSALGSIEFIGTSLQLAQVKGSADGTTDSAYLSFSTYPTGGSLTERMRITSSGNIGIGTTTPYSRFHVSQGASATTTVNFGEVGDTTSKACFNTKNVSGADISFYFSAANTLVIENNLCR